MDVLFEPNSRLFPFLQPLELLKLLHVSKGTRRATLPFLQASQDDPETKLHANRFRQWFTTAPIIAEGSMVFYEEMAEPEADNLAGPLRLETIETMARSFVDRFVVLEYKKIGYQKEHCKLAIFNERGEFVAYYELVSKQFYESFVDRRVLDDCGSNHSTPEIQIRNCSNANWTLHDQGVGWGWHEGFEGNIRQGNYQLFDCFYGHFSPTKVSFVLMHALSEDTRVIFQYVEAVFDSFSQLFDDVWGG